MPWDDSFDPDDPRKSFRKWLGDFFPDDVFQRFEEMMDEIFREISERGLFDPSRIEEMVQSPENVSPFIVGFSVRIGPDGKPVFQRFGNRPAPGLSLIHI